MNPVKMLLFGAIMLVLAVLGSIASTMSEVSSFTGSAVIKSGDSGILESILDVPKGYHIVNGTITIFNEGPGRVVLILGGLRNPRTLILDKGDNTSLQVSSGYEISTHTVNNTVSRIRIRFSGFIERYKGETVLAFSLLLFITGTVMTTIGLIIHILERIHKRIAG